MLASLTQVMITLSTGGDATVPNLGASGAIAGVLAAYLVLYPHALVNALIFITFTRVSAMLLIGFWFITQFIPALTALGRSSSAGGVAVWAHVGGFVAGLVLVKVFQRRQPQQYAPTPTRWYGGVTPRGGLRP